MNASRTMWRIVAITSILSTILLITGLVYAFQDIVYPIATTTDQHQNTPDSQGHDQNEIQIVGLGDSLTKGVGDPTGTGYIGYMRDTLATMTGKTVTITNNLAISGYRSDQLLADLKGSLAQSDALLQADLIVFSIGGNDLFQYVLEQANTLDQELDLEKLLSNTPDALRNMDEILSVLHEVNPQATIAYIGLYNPFLELDPTRQSSLAIAEWNDRVSRLMNPYPKMILIPTADLFQIHPQAYLSGDHFHPNQAGYARIAERIIPTIAEVQP